MEWLDSLPDEPFSGIVFANEVADALPVERFRIAPEGVESMHVGLDSGGFRWVARPAGRALQDHVRAVEARLGRPIGAAGYESEWCPSLGGWLEAVAGRLDRGLVLVFDYGYAEAEYYHPERDRGTLGCHYRHRWHDDPLVLPALQDITASVDFSALARAGDGAGLDRVGFTTQAWFLLGCGLTRLLAESAAWEGEEGGRTGDAGYGGGSGDRDADEAGDRDGSGDGNVGGTGEGTGDRDGTGDGGHGTARYAAHAHAVRQLTLPGEMGERIRVLGLGRALGEEAAAALGGFGGRRLDDRL